jgi:SAM-dependent methyltransferase
VPGRTQPEAPPYLSFSFHFSFTNLSDHATLQHHRHEHRGAVIADARLIDAEWNQVAWGNFDTNIIFLRRVGFAARPLRVLEIGCGKGAMLGFLRAAGHSVAGIDVDPKALSDLARRDPQAPVALASGDSIPFGSRSFDMVVSFDVFEHIQDSDRHMAEVRRVLKPRGRYLLQTPNKWTNIPFEILRQTRKMGVNPLQAYRELLKDHCALHNYWQLRRRFARHGFGMRYVDVPVVNEYFCQKVRTYMGRLGKAALAVANPDRFPRPLRTNFYVDAWLA